MKRKKYARIKNHPHVAAIDQAISAGVNNHQITKRFDTPAAGVKAYRENTYPKHVANAVLDRDRHALDTILARLNGGITKIEKITQACDEQLAREDGTYDLSNPKKAAPYVKMLIEAVKVLSPSLKDMAHIMGAVKERAEIENNPVLILAQIGQVIQASGSREEMIAGIRRLAQDHDRRD